MIKGNYSENLWNYGFNLEIPDNAPFFMAYTPKSDRFLKLNEEKLAYWPAVIISIVFLQ